MILSLPPFLSDGLRRVTLPLLLLFGLPGLLWTGGASCGPRPERVTSEGPGTRAEDLHDGGTEHRAASILGRGHAVWESNRTGDWRLWTRRFDDSPPRQLTPDEPGMQHCCPHLSPDGRSVVYLSRNAPRHEHPGEGTPGELRLLTLGDDGKEALIDTARTYGRGNRSAVWRSEEELIYIGADGRTRLRDLTGDETRILAPGAGKGLGWLIDPTLRYATSGVPTFSVYDSESGTVLERRDLGGCEPYFSHDGRWGFWVPGAGGPIDRIDLASREVSTILDKSDPRLGGKGYLYFPMLSRDGRLLAFGASDGEHSHFGADYDVFVAPTDPSTLELTGPPVRITTDSATDRYPDVFQAEPPEAREAWDETGGGPDAAAPVPREEPTERQGWPVHRESLVLLWQTGRSPNLVEDPTTGHLRTYGLEPRGRARLDHYYRMVLDDGAYLAPSEAADRLLREAVASNELTVEATLVPRGLSEDAEGDGMRPIVTFSQGRSRRNFTLGQQGRHLVVRLQTGLTGPNADRPQVRLFELEKDRAVHVAFTYSPGRLTAYRGGERMLETHAVTGSFTFHWKPGRLVFGGEAGRGGDWHGLLEGVALYTRELSPETLRESAARYRELRARRPPIPRWRVRGRLLAVSEIPTLAEISPYRRALAVSEYRVLGVAPGSDGAPSGTVRVAHWALLDGRTQPEAELEPGAVRTLVLEPYAANPQLEDVYLSDTLAPGNQPIYYDVEP